MSNISSFVLNAAIQNEIDQSWTKELSQRVSNVDSGKVTMQSRNKVMKNAREQLAQIEPTICNNEIYNAENR